jgi:hypothetical protein
MRAIMFPNSNVIFFVQSNDPTKVKPFSDPAAATDVLASTYGGWGRSKTVRWRWRRPQIS